MRLSEILTADRIALSFRAKDKSAALRQIAKVFVAANPALDEETIYRVFCEREALASTGVGHGIAIPHGRTANVQELQAVMAISSDGIPFDALDGEPAYILVAVLAPDKHPGSHLKALARVSRLLRDERVRRKLLSASDPEAAYSITVEEDEKQ